MRPITSALLLKRGNSLHQRITASFPVSKHWGKRNHCAGCSPELLPKEMLWGRLWPRLGAANKGRTAAVGWVQWDRDHLLANEVDQH